jgi:phage-related protein
MSTIADYPLIPLDGSFNDRTSYAARNRNAELVEGHARALGGDGYNPISHKRAIDITFQGLAKKREIQNFLVERAGIKPFRYQPFLDNTESVLYICKNFSFSRLSSTDVFRFSATFETAFYP